MAASSRASSIADQGKAQEVFDDLRARAEEEGDEITEEEYEGVTIYVTEAPPIDIGDPIGGGEDEEGGEIEDPFDDEDPFGEDAYLR